MLDNPSVKVSTPSLPAPALPAPAGNVKTPAAAAPSAVPSSAAPHSYFHIFDRLAGGLKANLGHGMSPTSLSLALIDWIINLSGAPGRQADLALAFWRDAEQLAADTFSAALNPKTPCAFPPSPYQTRFNNPAWQNLPYRLWMQTYLRSCDWWRQSTQNIPGLSPHHQDIVAFFLEQILVALSPANGVFTNPEIVEKIIETGGRNFIEGAFNFFEDANHYFNGQLPVGTEAYKVGQTVAITPGKVVLRNRLIELIQYSPTTDTVKAEPILIIPAWIMKYYILDLSPHNSLIAYLVSQGHTVFCVSWHNVTEEDRDLSLEDYRLLGVMAALDVVNTIVPNRKVHAVGYCLGGTLLSLAAAAMAEVGDERFTTMTLLAAQTDFSEPGALQVFIDENEIATLENLMWGQGSLKSSQMAMTFQMLRPDELIYGHFVQEYLLGERRPMIDLMAWNADATRMPYRMHSDYLRHFYLDNDLASGRYMIEGRTIALQNIRVPIFAVGTERDHVAPWKSVYKIHYLNDGDITFVLTKGGHNAGIISEPGHKNRSFKISHRKAGDTCLSQEEWEEAARPRQGSWWIAWEAWLTDHSSKTLVPPPSMGAPSQGYPPLADAPGSYVLET